MAISALRGGFRKVHIGLAMNDDRFQNGLIHRPHKTRAQVRLTRLVKTDRTEDVTLRFRVMDDLFHFALAVARRSASRITSACGRGLVFPPLNALYRLRASRFQAFSTWLDDSSSSKLASSF